ncbi:MAG: ATP-binding protein [Myxococcales bacterium]|nr:ATP-binding protein [Myxococcales bacterium]
MDDKHGALYGLKFHPFRPDVPVSALHVEPALRSFLFRVEQQLPDGGFVAISGAPGSGKSAALRVLSERLDALKDVQVGVLTRPQSNNADFYRELGHLFGVTLSPHNRWAGSKVLRERWLEHIDQTRTRPVLIIDEAQEMKPPVLAELRLLSSMNLDARALLTVVLAGDDRLSAKFRTAELLPVASRIRNHLQLGHREPELLQKMLSHLLDEAGRPDLITDAVQHALCVHAAGNPRTLTTMADNLLSHVYEHELEVIDEQTYFDVFQIQPEPTTPQPDPRTKRKRRAA